VVLEKRGEWFGVIEGSVVWGWKGRRKRKRTRTAMWTETGKV